MIRRPVRFTGMLLVCVLAFAVHAETITLADYLSRLERIRGELVSDLPAAQNEARSLMTAAVQSPAGGFQADTSLLGAIASGKAPLDLAIQSRLAATLAALRASASPTASRAADPALVERLRRDEKAAELTRGGEVFNPQVEETDDLKRAIRWVTKAYQWVVDLLGRVYDWIRKLWPSEPVKEGTLPATAGLPWMVTAVVILIVVLLLILAFEVIRRSRKAAPPAVAESEPVSSQRDDDPLSRPSNEWERYAQELAAAGRNREAIRAWYHAVLVTLFSGVILHFRKGRTNWEYLASLPASLQWRPQMIELTHRFEREWYGHAESPAEALEECRSRAQRILDAVRRNRSAAA
ncbi:MAG: hypothetical protein JWN02_248 [Acidobacteria bacterium]|nr:hypothetical protein [Acidobacteriota bacterium]